MPLRITPLVTDNYYHVYNRGVAKQLTFFNPRHFFHFERTLSYYLALEHKVRFSQFLRFSQIHQQSYLLQRLMTAKNRADIIAYCLMPNHFHLLLKQTSENGISTLMQLLGNSYTKYINTATHRVGHLFQGQFKATLIDTNDYLLHLSRYIHLNPLHLRLVTQGKLSSYKYSSFTQYTSPRVSSTIVVKPDIILNQFKDKRSYQNFCLDHVSYASSITQLSHLLIDPDD
jgi:putative transposase